MCAASSVCSVRFLFDPVIHTGCGMRSSEIGFSALIFMTLMSSLYYHQDSLVQSNVCITRLRFPASIWLMKYNPMPVIRFPQSNSSSASHTVTL